MRFGRPKIKHRHRLKAVMNDRGNTPLQLGVQHDISLACFPLYPKRMIFPLRLRHR